LKQAVRVADNANSLEAPELSAPGVGYSTQFGFLRGCTCLWVCLQRTPPKSSTTRLLIPSSRFFWTDNGKDNGKTEEARTQPVRVKDNVEISSARRGQRKFTRNDRVAGADQWLPYKNEISRSIQSIHSLDLSVETLGVKFHPSLLYSFCFLNRNFLQFETG
jgi:hypothetical protein